MERLPMGGEVSVFDGRSLNLELHRNNMELERINASNFVKSFNSLKQLNLPETASLHDIAKRLPQHSMLQIDVYGGTHGATMPLPTMKEQPAPSYMSGILFARKAGDTAKVYFEWRNEYYMATCEYNKHNHDSVDPWYIHPRNNMNYAYSANFFGGKIANIIRPGTYYFPSNQMAAFSDSPTTNGSYIVVRNGINTQATTFAELQWEITEGTIYSRKWVRTGSNSKWVSIPILIPDAVADEHLRIGDMKVAGNGRVHMRVASGTVGQLSIDQ